MHCKQINLHINGFFHSKINFAKLSNLMPCINKLYLSEMTLVSSGWQPVVVTEPSVYPSPPSPHPPPLIPSPPSPHPLTPHPLTLIPSPPSPHPLTPLPSSPHPQARMSALAAPITYIDLGNKPWYIYRHCFNALMSSSLLVWFITCNIAHLISWITYL